MCGTLDLFYLLYHWSWDELCPCQHSHLCTTGEDLAAGLSGTPYLLSGHYTYTIPVGSLWRLEIGEMDTIIPVISTCWSYASRQSCCNVDTGGWLLGTGTVQSAFATFTMSIWFPVPVTMPKGSWLAEITGVMMSVQWFSTSRWSPQVGYIYIYILHLGQAGPMGLCKNIHTRKRSLIF